MSLENTYFELKTLLREDVTRGRINNIIICNAFLNLLQRKEIETNDSILVIEATKINFGLKEELVDKLNKILSQYSKSYIIDLVYYIINNAHFISITEDYNTKYELSKLIYSLLNLNKTDILLDFGSGRGDFLINIVKLLKENNNTIDSLNGIEINAELATISKVLMSLLVPNDIKFNIENKNGLVELDCDYNKAYICPPIGIKKLVLEEEQSKLFENIKLTSRATDEWIYIDKVLSKLTSIDSRAVALVSRRALFNKYDFEYRNELLKKGLIEQIIELPAGTSLGTSHKFVLIVFSCNNKQVKFVNAAEAITKRENYKYNNFSANKALEIIDNQAVYKNIVELLQESNLTPSIICMEMNDIVDGIKLKDVAEVFNGCQYTVSIFDKKGLLSETKTNYRIITSLDIEDGLINWENLKYITDGSKFDKYSVKSGDLIMAAKSSKIKLAVVDSDPECSSIVTGGMMIIRSNKEKLNPTYLKMFLESKTGQLALKRIQKGQVIITINPSDLYELQIPNVDMVRQVKMAFKYNNVLNTIAVYKNQIKLLEDKLNNIIDDLEGDF